MSTPEKADIIKTEALVTRHQQHAPLSFFERWFTLPVAGPFSKKSSSSAQSSTDGLIQSTEQQNHGASHHRAPKFSFRSKGALIAGAVVAMITFTALAIALALSSHARHHDRFLPSLPHGDLSNQPAYNYTNPPIRLGILANFPDPSIYYESKEHLWYAFGTNNAAGILNAAGNNSYSQSNIQIATSADFLNWSLYPASSDPLPQLGAWAAQNLNGKEYKGGKLSALIPIANVWAPDMIQHPVSGKHLFYYSARAANYTAHCVGAAVADGAAGPFKSLDKPLACPVEKGGAIDPAAFVDDDGSIQVVYKIDGNSKGHGGECANSIEPVVSTPIMLQKMLSDGLTPDPGLAPVQILDRTAADGPLVEAPHIIKSGDTYFLFYSSGCTRDPDYTVKVATAPKVTGPYTRSTGPLLKTGDFGLYAPGSVSVRWAPDTTHAEEHGGNRRIPSNGRWKIALHGRVKHSEGAIRAMFTAGLEFAGTSVKVVNGTMSVT